MSVICSETFVLTLCYFVHAARAVAVHEHNGVMSIVCDPQLCVARYSGLLTPGEVSWCFVKKATLQRPCYKGCPYLPRTPEAL